jgi:hypothetical protein
MIQHILDVFISQLQLTQEYSQLDLLSRRGVYTRKIYNLHASSGQYLNQICYKKYRNAR